MKIDLSTDELVNARLSAIAESLFGPSADTLAAVALGGDAVLSQFPAELRERITGPRYRRRLEVLRATLAGAAPVDRTPWLTDFKAPPEPLAGGEVRFVEGVDLNDPDSDRRYTEPILVLLDRPVARHPDEPPSLARVWQAWTVSPHAGLAGYWDVLLQGDDVPADCAMVQVWNRVSVAEPDLGRCRYRLSAEQLRDVGAVWREFVSGVEEPEEAEGSAHALMTAGIRSTVHNQWVVTGTPSTGPDDPRFLFQRFYVLVRETLEAACERAQRAGATSADSQATRSNLPATAPVDPWVAALKETTRVLASLSIRGLQDGLPRSPEGVRELAASDRLTHRESAGDAGEAAWVQAASYSANDQELSLLGLRGLLESTPPESVEFQFFVCVPLKTASAAEAQEERIPVEHHRVEGTRATFVLSSNLPLAERILGGRLDLEIEIRGNEADRLIVIGILRASR